LGRIQSLDDAGKEEKLWFAEAAFVLGNLCLVARLLVEGLGFPAGHNFIHLSPHHHHDTTFILKLCQKKLVQTEQKRNGNFSNGMIS